MKEITNLKELQEIELGILKIIHQFCVEKGIQYYLAYGSLLGAIRHNGFIPWDDDIDIHMKREDYNIFEREFPKWKDGKGIYVAGPHSKEHYYPRDMLKVCDDRTILKETLYNRKPIGVFVDVWPLDKLPISGSSVFLHKLRFLRNVLLVSDIDMTSEAYKRLSSKAKIATRLFALVNTERLMKKFEKEAQTYDELEDNFIYFNSLDNMFFYEKTFFDSCQLHSFEDSDFYIPNGYDGILTQKYGDYMKLPPAEKQKPHHIQDTWWA